MRILGLDVGNNCVTLCCLDSFPNNIKQYFKQHRKEFIRLTASKIGVEKLLAYQPDAIVLEPTGHWYSHFWYKVAVENDIEVFWIGHAQLAHKRGSYGFKNKRDEEDALSLAATYFDTQFIDEFGNKRFLNRYRHDAIVNLRELFLKKEQLAKLRNNLIAQLKQRLSYEFPELAVKTFKISDIRGFTPVVGWLGGLLLNKRYDNLYAASVARSLNIEISEYTRAHSRMLVGIEQRITSHYEQIEKLLEMGEFEPYQQVFDNFGFGTNNRALLLYHIYPFERFLVNDKPWIEWEESKGKMQKRDRSLRKFQAFLGMKYVIDQSGDKYKRKFGGSATVRAHLYPWAVCQIAPTKYGYKVNTPMGRALTDRYIQMRQEQKIKGKDALMRLLFKATRMLFYELVKEIS